MTHESIPSSPEKLAKVLYDLRLKRRRRKEERRASVGRRRALSAADRKSVIEKTNGRCHICGGSIKGGRWQADHVFSHSGGGSHAVDNYLPAHALCNNYRWDYSADEFQSILKLGVWVRSEIERKSGLGLKVAERYLAHERARAARQIGMRRLGSEDT